MLQIEAIQILRALAAGAVAFGHALGDAEKVAAAGGGAFWAPSADLTGAGVDLFFVISGFVMVHASGGLFEAPGGARLFLGRRVARIAPLYWAATSLMLLIALLAPGALNGGAPSLAEIAKSYLFVPYLKAEDGLMQPVYKLGWTLNYEMFFYAAFALVIAWPMRRAVTALSLGFIALVIAGLALRPEPGALRFWSQPIILEFVLGAWLGLAFAEGVRLGRLAATGLVAFGALLLVGLHAAGVGGEGGVDRLLWVGLPCAMIVAGASLREPARFHSAPARFLVRLGDASFALYLIHPFVIRALRLVWTKAGLAGIASPWLYLVVVMTGAIAVSFLSFRLFETPVTRRVQAWLGVASTRQRLAAPPGPALGAAAG